MAEQVAGGWRKLHSEELHNLYSSTNNGHQIKEDEMGGACSAHRNDEKCLSNFSWKTWREGNTWETWTQMVFIGVDLKEIDCENVD
jgi:hypothetical protein